jgi:hypothetical protein
VTSWASRFTGHQEDPVTSRSDRTHNIKVKQKITSLWTKLLYVFPLFINKKNQGRCYFRHGVTRASGTVGRG